MGLGLWSPRGHPAGSWTCSSRPFTVYPFAKLCFRHLGACPNQVLRLRHGRRVSQAVGVAVQQPERGSEPAGRLARGRDASGPRQFFGEPLRGPALSWRVRHEELVEQMSSHLPLLPQLPIQCFQVVLASHLQGEFKVEMQAAWRWC